MPIFRAQGIPENCGFQESHSTGSWLSGAPHLVSCPLAATCSHSVTSPRSFLNLWDIQFCFFFSSLETSFFLFFFLPSLPVPEDLINHSDFFLPSPSPKIFSITQISKETGSVVFSSPDSPTLYFSKSQK